MARVQRGAPRTLLANLGDKGLRRKLLRCLALSAALPAMISGPVWAQRWEVAPTLSVSETYTDNISLTQDASKQSEWITQITPGISIAATGARFRFKGDYAPEFVHYAEGTKGNDVFHRGSAFGHAELAEQLLFIEAGGRVDQYDVSLRGPLTTSNVNTTGNRATVKTFFVSPYLVRDFGTAVRGEARLTYSALNSNSATALSDNDASRIDLKLASGPTYKRFTWDIGYRRENTKYDAGQETVTEVITTNGKLLITPNVGLLAMVGHESYDSGIPGSVFDESRWSIGLDWTPTPRTRLAATAGKRFDEDAYSFEFRHRTRLTTWSAGYSEDVTATRSEFFVPATASTASYLDQLFLPQYPDPIARQKAVEEFIARTGLPPNLSSPLNFFSERLFRTKRWQASAGLLGVRNTLLANVYRETRDSLFPGLIQPGAGDFAASNGIRVTGASLVWNWRVTPQNTWNLGTGYTQNEFSDSNRVDDLSYIRMGLTRQFQPRVFGSLNYSRQRNQSNQSAFSYTENAVTAVLQMRF